MPKMNMPYGGDKNYGTRKPFGKKKMTMPYGQGQQSGESGSGYPKRNSTSAKSSGSYGTMRNSNARPKMSPRGYNSGKGY